MSLSKVPPGKEKWNHSGGRPHEKAKEGRPPGASEEDRRYRSCACFVFRNLCRVVLCSGHFELLIVFSYSAPQSCGATPFYT